jgi:hypothetical protein
MVNAYLKVAFSRKNGIPGRLSNMMQPDAKVEFLLVVFPRNDDTTITNNPRRGKMAKHHKHSEHLTPPKRKWWQWVALGLMLLAIGTYVLTLDDSTVLDEKVTSGAPTAAVPAPRQ